MNFTAADAAEQGWRDGRLAFKLRPTQLELREWWREKTSAAMSIAHCARGYGKTFWFLSEATEAAMKTHPITRDSKLPVRMVYAAPTRDQAKSIILPSAEIFFADCPADIRPTWVSTDHAYVWPNGSFLRIDGADDNRGNLLRGPYAHIVFCDELGFWRHCKYVLKVVLMPQTKRGQVQGRVLAASTSPESVGHEFVGLCREAQGEGAYIVRTIDDDTTLTEAEREKNMRDVAEEKNKATPRLSTMVRREHLCEFVTETERAVIPEFDEKLHVTRRDHRPEWCDKYTAMDLGLIDHTHVVFAHYDFQRAKIVIEAEHMAHHQTTLELAAAVKEAERALWTPDAKEWRSDVPKMRISDNELQQIFDLGQTHGIHFRPALKYDADAALNNLRGLFAQRRIEIHERCKQLIYQLKVGIWNERRTDYVRLPNAGHLDGIDAIKYLARHIDYQTNPLPPIGLAPDRYFIPPDMAETHSRNVDALKKLVGTGVR